jgi:hypothetical protein
MFCAKLADNPGDKGGLSGSRRTGDEHAGLNSIGIHSGVIVEGLNKVEDLKSSGRRQHGWIKRCRCENSF